MEEITYGLMDETAPLEDASITDEISCHLIYEQ